ncbi:MAG: undecaprenyldiphospho-muramoylpentapeptide beta-N-acetylglucosaminyltransferase [FCB group bacterium]|nr:undecaprenyldiphospho-muramoylpentapeptide beta-N-acetylglucosaminyltransferase [FCB group bacterium]
MAERLKIAIAGGGTGGHLFPAIAIGEELKRRRPEALIHYFGSTFGIEAEVLPLRPHPFTLVPVRGLQRGIYPSAIGRNFLLPIRLPRSQYRVRKVMKSLNPSIVIGTGGYASAIPVRTALKMKVPVVLQEQNSYPGITTRWYAHRANLVCLGFEDVDSLINGKKVVTGNPVRKGINLGSRERGLNKFRFSGDKPILFLFGGSQGSTPLNRFMNSMVDLLKQKGIQVLWQTGQSHYDNYSRYESDRIRVIPFLSDMADAYAVSDLILSRSGALALAEIAVCGKPSILIPFPGAAGDHQTRNALSLEDHGAAVVLDERDLSADYLFETIITLIVAPDRLKNMGMKALELSKPDATRDIVDQILTVCEA